MNRVSFLGLFGQRPKAETASVKEVIAPECVAYGEVLWDVFESHSPSIPRVKRLGGAPANFAYHTRQLGAKSEIISALGKDQDGDALLRQIDQLGLPHRAIQRCPYFHTGTVSIQTNSHGEPEYTIHEGVAWDDIEPTTVAVSLVQHADIFYYGTLAQRSQKSRATLYELVRQLRDQSLRVFDVNIRGQHYSTQMLLESLPHATVLKMSEQDLPRLANALSLPLQHGPLAAHLFKRYARLELVALTMGQDGSELISREGEHAWPAESVTVKDSVGAGDAFTAVVALGWHRRMPLDQINRLASRVAGFVCTQSGATPKLPAEFRQLMGY